MAKKKVKKKAAKTKTAKKKTARKKTTKAKTTKAKTAKAKTAKSKAVKGKATQSKTAKAKAAKAKTTKAKTATSKPVKGKTAKSKTVKSKPLKSKTAERHERARTEPTEMRAGKKSIKPFEVCNHFGVHLRDIFEKEHWQNRRAQLGEVFEYLLRDLHGAWNMVKLYGKETPLEKLRGESNPFHYDL